MEMVKYSVDNISLRNARVYKVERNSWRNIVLTMIYGDQEFFPVFCAAFHFNSTNVMYVILER